MGYEYIWTDGTNKDFVRFSRKMEEYYDQLVGGESNRKSFIPYNGLSDIHYVLMVYDGEVPAACASFKEYAGTVAEIKRVWVEPEYRRQGIAREMMSRLESRAKDMAFERAVLQTREACADAVSLYKAIGYEQTENYPPYDKMPLAVCYAKDL